jgi:membrane protein required for colicin V production
MPGGEKMSFGTIDIIALVVLAIAALRITFKGFIPEFMSKAGLIVGLLAALMFSSLLTPVIEQQLGLGRWNNVISFVIIFLAGYLLMKLFSSVLTNLLEALHLDILDHIFGFALGLIEGAIVISLLVYLLKLQSLIDVSAMLESSWVVQLLEPIAPYGLDFFKGSTPPSV